MTVRIGCNNQNVFGDFKYISYVLSLHVKVAISGVLVSGQVYFQYVETIAPCTNSVLVRILELNDLVDGIASRNSKALLLKEVVDLKGIEDID